MAMQEEAAALHAAGRTAGAISRLEAALQLVKNDGTTIKALTAYRAALGIDGEGNPVTAPGIAVAGAPAAGAPSQSQAGDKVDKVTLDLVPKTKKPAKAKAGDASNDN
jgi:hypothetical protein